MSGPLLPASDRIRARFPRWEITTAIGGRIWSAERKWNGGRRRRYIIAGSAPELLVKLLQAIPEDER